MEEVSLYTITNKNGLEASVTDLGAVWVRMVVPDKKRGYGRCDAGILTTQLVI